MAPNQLADICRVKPIAITSLLQQKFTVLDFQVVDHDNRIEFIFLVLLAHHFSPPSLKIRQRTSRKPPLPMSSGSAAVENRWHSIDFT